MAELGANYNIQCMKLFQELKAEFPCIPDSVVRQCMKQHRNDLIKCKEELARESENFAIGRYGVRINKGNQVLSGARVPRARRSARRYSVADNVSECSSSSDNVFARACARPPPRPRVLRTHSLSSETWPREPGHVPSDPRDQCDSAGCDKNENEVLFENRVNNIIETKMNDIPECHIDGENNDAFEIPNKINEDVLEDDENNNTVPRNNSTPLDSASVSCPRPLTLCGTTTSIGSHVDTIPTVVLTPDSPPQQSPSVSRKVKTLYTPESVDLETTVIESQDVIFPPQSLEQELRKSLSRTSNLDPEDESVIICGKNDTVTNSVIDIVPGLGHINLPFGSTESTAAVRPETAADFSVSVTKSTTSVTQGKVHVVKDIGDGTVSIATTTFCSLSHSVLSTASWDGSKPNAKCKTVLYTINRKPIICENPFRKVFARRKEFYQSREDRDATSPELSSNKLIWRHSNHNCRRLTCPPAPGPEAAHQAPDTEGPSPHKYFTLNANIEPFDPFIIKHDISRGLDAKRSSTSPMCSTVNLTLCPQSSRDSSPPVEVLPDGSGLKYHRKVAEEDGSEACLEVKVDLGGSTITTKRTGRSDEVTSNEISLRLVPGSWAGQGAGPQLNIQQSSQTTQQPRPAPAPAAPERPSSLQLPALAAGRYPGSRHAHSLHQGRGTSPQSLPRYNSLPSFKSVAGSGSSSWEYAAHPRDEEKRLAYTRALLSHQMDQLLKLHKELAEGKKEVDGMKSDIKVLEQELKAQDLMLQGQAPKIVVEVKQLETDIDNLRGACNQMSEKVTHLTAGKVPLGETSINFENYLTAAQTSVPESSTSGVPGATLSSNPLLPRPAVSQEMARWSCSECTFQNHPSLEACEICEMPRLVLG